MYNKEVSNKRRDALDRSIDVMIDLDSEQKTGISPVAVFALAGVFAVFVLVLMGFGQ